MTRKSLVTLYFSIVVLLSSGSLLAAQQPDVTSIVNQIDHVFSGRKLVTNVQLSGQVIWHAGSLEDSGSASLIADSSGAMQIQLSLAKKGAWMEAQEKIASGMACSWSGSDQIVHYNDVMNCSRPTVWFFPLITLQSSAMSSGVGVADLGSETIESRPAEHLQIQAVFSDLPDNLLARSMHASTTNLDIDSVTLLPVCLRYEVKSDNGASTAIPIEIRYSDYRNVNGVKVPFLIQRYINGSLQLEIHLDSAQVN